MLLFDEHFSYRSSKNLRPLFPGLCHVSDVGLLGAKDGQIWDYCLQNNLVLVTRDYDFFHWSIVREPKPKIIYLSGENISRRSLEQTLTKKAPAIISYLSSDDVERLYIKL